MPATDPRIDAYIAKSADFAKPILQRLRKIVHAGCPDVEETLKWRSPAFMYKGMFAGMAAFKNHCIFGFWKHSLLRDRGLLKSDDAMGQFGRITSIDELPDDKTLLRLVKAAAALNDRGVKVPRAPRPAKRAPLKVPSFFTTALRRNKKAQAAFDAFSYSDKKEYVEWIGEAKTDETRQRRLETAVAWIAEGKGRNWKYERR